MLVKDQILGQKDLFTAAFVVQARGALPTKVQYAISWNLLFHSVEWRRTAYYDDYGITAI